MRRSVVVHEFKERRGWDEDFDGDGDGEGVAGERVRCLEVSGEEEEGGVVGEWVEDLL